MTTSWTPVGYWAWDEQALRHRELPPDGRAPTTAEWPSASPTSTSYPDSRHLEIDLLGKPIDADTRGRLYLARIRQETTVRRGVTLHVRKSAIAPCPERKKR
jgi:hypothetical protein